MAATTTPAALAALEPIPLPGLICFLLINVNPFISGTASKNAKSAAPATFSSALSGRLKLSSFIIVTPLVSLIVKV